MMASAFQVIEDCLSLGRQINFSLQSVCFQLVHIGPALCCRGLSHYVGCWHPITGIPRRGASFNFQLLLPILSQTNVPGKQGMMA